MAKVLIVDDCSVMRLVIKRILGISGFDVEEYYFAGDGEAALSILRQNQVDVVISDINMPKLDGESMLKIMREDAGLNHIPVVMVSSDATDSRASRLTALGAQAYLVKPFRPEELRDRLERVLGLAHA